MARFAVEMEIDFPEGVQFREYHRREDGHAFHVDWAWAERCRCETCRHEAAANVTLRNTFQLVRDLDVADVPTFYAYQPPVHQCPRCGHRQYLPPPFKRKDVKYTYRFEEHVLASLVGSTEAEVAERLGIAAETVAWIVKHRLADRKAKTVDAARVITDIGIDEISLKKRHKLYATVLTDLTDPQRPQILALAEGKDEAATRTCLEALTPAQRAAVRTHRTDLSPAIQAACRALLPESQSVLDRFHVAKLAGDLCDRRRKKNHGWLQAEPDDEGTAGLSFADVGVSPAEERLVAGRAGPPGGLV